MTPRHRSSGKEVLRDETHFADCLTEAAATQIAGLLNIAEEVRGGPLGVSLAIDLCRRVAELTGGAP